MKDWTGNKKSIFTCLGASNHSLGERQKDDFYATDPKAAELLLDVEPDLGNIWECACGEGHLAKVFEKYGILNAATDLVYRGYGNKVSYDFLKPTLFGREYFGDIVTNPPYKYAQQFVETAINLVAKNRKVCMFLKLTFLEGKRRKKLFKKYPPKVVYVSSARLKCALNGDFDDTGSSAAAYAWFVWEKGYSGDTIIKWIN